MHPTQAKTATTDDYTYDDNGNLKKDLNKDIGNATTDGIMYNYLNLPQTITVRKDANGANIKGTIDYVYDATGNKLKKNTTETNATVNVNGTNYTTNITTTTDYTSGFIYETKTYSNATVQASLGSPTKLQFTGHEEGRVRPTYSTTNNQLTGFVYDYMLKDHLGNVRMVLTDEVKVDAYPPATLEPLSITTEELFYGNLSSTQVNKPEWFNDPNYVVNTKVSKLRNDNTSVKIGPNIILKVMSGDRFSVRVAGGWSSEEGNVNGDVSNILSELLPILSNGLAGNSGGKVTAADLQNPASGLNASLLNFLNSQTTVNAHRPRSYLNWILFDEQFKMVSSSSGFVQVGKNGMTVEIKIQPNLTIDKNGYLYIYTSNQSQNIDVYFDNLQITHTRGSILEETHYYPFGLTMAGISSKAAGMVENKKKYQQYELNTDFDINLYESFYRSHDPQLGRFWQVDPRPTDFESPYATMGNNPIRNIDILGDSILGRSNNSTANTIERKINSQITENSNDITRNNVKLDANRKTIVSALTGFKKVSKEDFKRAVDQSKTLLGKNTELTEQNSHLNTGLEAINLMREDVNNNYSFSSPSNNDGTHNVIKGEGKNVIIEGSNNGLYLHEAVHVRQHLTTGNGMLRFALRDNVGKLINVSATGSRIGDEVQAYKVQFSFNREAANLFPRKLSDINADSVRGIGENGVFPYRDL